MKTRLSFGLMLAAAGVLFACSDEGEGERDPVGGSAGQTGNNGGNGGANGGASGNPGTGGGGTTGSGGMVNLGDAFVIGELEDGNVPIADTEGNTGINGAAYLVQSMTAAMEITTPATLSAPSGTVCMAGNTVPVPPAATGGDNYTEYWGAEIDFDLNRTSTGAEAPADAGADAGDAGPPVLGTVASAWDPTDGNVIGFSFVVTGNDMELPGGGIPAAFRFKTLAALPDGTPANSSTDNFCYTASPVSGAPINVLFTDIRRNCWDTGTPSVFEDPAGFTQLVNLGWQVPAAPAIAYQFNFCVSDIKPILGN